MDNLTEEQRAKFAAKNALLGLGPNEYTVQFSEENIASLPKELVFSSNADESHFLPHYVPVASIAEMRRIAGFAEEYEDKGQQEPDYPAAPSGEELDLANSDSANISGTLGAELRDRIRRAAEAYVAGDPAKVKDYEPLINATMFPGRAAVFTGEVLEVPANTTYVVKGADPVILHFEKIIVGDNGTIRVETSADITTYTFVQQQ